MNTSPRTRRLAALTTTAALLVAGLGSAATAAADEQPDTVLPAADRYRPTALPDRLVLVPTEDPATSQRVNWRSTASAPRAQIVEAPAAFGDVLRTQAEKYDVRTVDAYRTAEASAGAAGYTNEYHTVEFADLKPGTRYAYRVGDGTAADPSTSGSGAGSISNWSAWQHFTTAAEGAEPFSFVYFGDAQNYIDSAVPRVFTEALLDRPDARLTLHAGDLMNQTGTSESALAVQDKEWAEWFAAGETANATRNVLATPGNHEYNSSTAISSFWKPQFPFPENGPTSESDPSVEAKTEQSVYYVDYQGVRFISLDSSPLQNGPVQTAVRDAQTAWLEGLLTDPERPKWTVVTFHHPVYAGTSSRNNAEVRNHWNPLLQKHGVDLVLQGHDHVYNRGNATSADDPQDPARSNGTVYSISVSGGKMYALNQGQNWSDNGANLRVRGENLQLFQLVDVEADTLTYQARLANDEFYDGYVVTKKGESWDGEKSVVDLTTDPEVETPAEPEPEPAVTPEVALTASATTVAEGETVDLAVTVSEGAAGRVQLLDGGEPVGEPVEVADGAAAWKGLELGVGAHALQVTFAPADAAAFTPASSAALALLVTPAVSDAPPAWDRTTIYTEGDRVTHDGTVYEAKWWTRNQVPGDPWGPWSKVG